MPGSARKPFDPDEQTQDNEDFLDRLVRGSLGSPPELDTSVPVREPSPDQVTKLGLAPDGKLQIQPRGRTNPKPPSRVASVPSPPVTHIDPEDDLQANPPQMMGAGNQTPPAANLRPAATQRATPDEVSNRPPVSEVPTPTPFGPMPDIQGIIQGQQDKNAKLLLLQGLARAGDTANRALTNQPQGPSATADMIGSQIHDPLEKAHSMAALDQLSRAGMLQQLKMDPNSPFNARIRDASERALNLPPGTLSGLTADEVEKTLPTIGSHLNAQASHELAVETEKARIEAEKHRVSEDDIRNQLAAQGLDLRATQNQVMAALAGKRMDQSDAHFDATKQAEYGKAMSEFAPFYAGYKRIFDTMDRLGQLPGTGPIQGRIGAWFTQPEGLRFRQEVQNMALNYDKQIGGVRAVNPAMADRMAQATGLIKTGTDNQILAGLHMLKDTSDAHLQAIRAGYSPNVVSAVDARGGVTPGAGQQAAKPGKVHITNGKESFYVDPADVKEAQGEGFRVVP